MATSITSVSQYVQGLVNGRPLNVFSVKDFGATGDGGTNDTPAIQATIDAVQAIFLAQTGEPVNGAVRASVPMVYFPPGRYKTNVTLNVTCQIHLVGSGFLSAAICGEADAPIFNVTIGTPLLYAAAQFVDLAICGDIDTAGGGTKPLQHGIQVNYNPIGNDATLIVTGCAIEGCGGHGIYFPDNANTPRISHSIIQRNWLDGIHFSGSALTASFATAAQIIGNVIQLNRRGIFYDGTAAANANPSTYLYSGTIIGNLFQANTNGTGRAGSDSRPCRAIEANNVRELVIMGNYFELHLNHIWLGIAGTVTVQSSHYDRVLHNFFTGAEVVPGMFPDAVGPAFKPADVVIVSSDSIGMWIEGNAIAPHQRPASTLPQYWSGGNWGDTVEAWPYLSGRQHVIRNDAGAGQTIDLVQNPHFRELYTLDYQIWGLRRGDYGIALTPLDGSFVGGEYFEISSRVSALSVVGRSALRFYRRADGSAALEVWANDAADAIQSVARFNGATRLTSVEGLAVTEGANQRMGTATLAAGTVVVSTTRVTANSRIFLTGQNLSGTVGELTVSARTAGASFTIRSSSTSDTRSVAWLIVEPGP